MRVLAAISVLGLCACAAGSDAELVVGERSGAIIYGNDDRKDVHAVEDAELRGIAQWSTLALISQNRLFRPNSGGVELVAPLLKDTLIRLTDNGPSYLVCESEPYREQPAVADCTGVLIDDDLVLTAAHCLREGETCDVFAYVFDFFESAPGELERISASDVFGCRGIVARFLSPDSSTSKVDYAIVQLDRTPLARRPVNVREARADRPLEFAEPFAKDDPLFAVGYPSGLPAKVDTGARVTAARTSSRDFFYLNSDTFKGSSGSGIFDQNNELVGLLVRGSKDYELSADESCVSSKVVSDETGSDTGVGWEEATYVTQAIDGLCKTGYPSPRLCDIEPTCGDGFCTGGENVESCAEDCEANDCAARACGKGRDLPIVGDQVVDDAGALDGDGGAVEGMGDGVAKRKKAPKCAAAPDASVDFAALAALTLSLAALLWRRRYGQRARC